MTFENKMNRPIDDGVEQYCMFILLKYIVPYLETMNI